MAKNDKLASYLWGLSAEEAVVRHYIDMGYSLLATRERTPEGEIDVIMRMSDVIIFIEVKARSTVEYSRESISVTKLKRLEKAAICYIAKSVGVFNDYVRFDAAFVYPNGKIDTVENVWSCEF